VDDVDAGCVDLSAVARGGPKACPQGALVVAGRRFVCVSAEAACPQGSHARPDTPAGDAGAADGGGSGGGNVTCDHPPSCPPGTLPSGGACRPVVLRGARSGTGAVVDLGAWAALVLGADGGPGSSDLCRPLQLHPFEVGLAPGESAELRLRIALRVPDQDVSAVHGHVDVTLAAHPLARPPLAGEGPRQTNLGSASALAERALAALIEPLRGLGGDSTASALEVEVRCVVASL
jgi:hypothetical protein